MRGTAETYRVFVRNWWRRDPSSPYTRGGVRVSPDPGARKTTLATRCTYAEARAICERYSATHNPGPLSRKPEFERE